MTAAPFWRRAADPCERAPSSADPGRADRVPRHGGGAPLLHRADNHLGHRPHARDMLLCRLGWRSPPPRGPAPSLPTRLNPVVAGRAGGRVRGWDSRAWPGSLPHSQLHSPPQYHCRRGRWALPAARAMGTASSDGRSGRWALPAVMETLPARHSHPRLRCPTHSLPSLTDNSRTD